MSATSATDRIVGSGQAALIGIGMAVRVAGNSLTEKSTRHLLDRYRVDFNLIIYAAFDIA